MSLPAWRRPCSPIAAGALPGPAPRTPPASSRSRASAGARPVWPCRVRFRPGNLFPVSLIRVARWGWETIDAVTGAYALLTVLDLLFDIKPNTALIVVTLLPFVTATFLSGLGTRALRVCSTWSAYLFGGFSVLVLGHIWWSARTGGPSWTSRPVRPRG